MDCGPTCLRMVAKHYGRNISLQTFREKTQIGKEGVNILGISMAEKVSWKVKNQNCNTKTNSFLCKGIKFFVQSHTEVRVAQLLLMNGFTYYSSTCPSLRWMGRGGVGDKVISKTVVSKS